MDPVSPQAARDYLADLAHELAELARAAGHQQSAGYFEIARLSLIQSPGVGGDCAAPGADGPKRAHKQRA